MVPLREEEATGEFKGPLRIWTENQESKAFAVTLFRLIFIYEENLIPRKFEENVYNHLSKTIRYFSGEAHVLSVLRPLPLSSLMFPQVSFNKTIFLYTPTPSPPTHANWCQKAPWMNIKCWSLDLLYIIKIVILGEEIPGNSFSSQSASSITNTINAPSPGYFSCC